MYLRKPLITAVLTVFLVFPATAFDENKINSIAKSIGQTSLTGKSFLKAIELYKQGKIDEGNKLKQQVYNVAFGKNVMDAFEYLDEMSKSDEVKKLASAPKKVVSEKFSNATKKSKEIKSTHITRDKLAKRKKKVSNDLNCPRGTKHNQVESYQFGKKTGCLINIKKSSLKKFAEHDGPSMYGATNDGTSQIVQIYHGPFIQKWNDNLITGQYEKGIRHGKWVTKNTRTGEKSVKEYDNGTPVGYWYNVRANGQKWNEKRYKSKVEQKNEQIAKSNNEKLKEKRLRERLKKIVSSNHWTCPTDAKLLTKYGSITKSINGDFLTLTKGCFISSGSSSIRDTPHGISAVWHSNGTKLTEIEFVNGVRHGKFQAWHNNGKQRANGKFEHDKEVGEWTFFHEDGSTHEIKEFANGHLINKRVINRKPASKDK